MTIFVTGGAGYIGTEHLLMGLLNIIERLRNDGILQIILADPGHPLPQQAGRMVKAAAKLSPLQNTFIEQLKPFIMLGERRLCAGLIALAAGYDAVIMVNQPQRR